MYIYFFNPLSMINIKRLIFVSSIFACLFMGGIASAQKINQFDKNKKRTGVWKKYYPNKRIRYQGQFKDGKEIGIFKFYDITTSGFPVITKKYSEFNDSVFVQFFTLKGKLQSKGMMIKKKRVGIWKYYFSNGKLLSEENYIDGILHGELLNYYPNGKVTEHTQYKNGLKHGVSKKYSDSGILIEEVMYENGKPNGLAKYFELSGNLKEKGMYKNGKRAGKWEFYLDGELATEKEKKEKKSKYKKS